MGSVLSSAVPYLADALVILGLFVMTVGVYGVIRMPDTYTRLHATSKAVFLGVVSLCVASVVTGDPAIIYRAMLIGAFLLVTTPISAFVVARLLNAGPASARDLSRRNTRSAREVTSYRSTQTVDISSSSAESRRSTLVLP